MLTTLFSIIGIIITIFFVVGTHEFAHFIVARWMGVKVIRFSIGFGKKLWSWRDKKNTEYVIAAIPLGGYVQMVDENEGEVVPQDLAYAYNRQPYYKKFLIVLAGPAMNLLCAFVLYWIIFMIGFVTVKPIIGSITQDSIAANYGLKPNQEIKRVDNSATHTWTGVIFRLLVHAGNKDHVEVEVQDLKTQKVSQHKLNLSTWSLSNLTPDPLASLGIVPYQPEIPLYIGLIATNSPAQQTPLRVGDKILAINDQPIKDWQSVNQMIQAHPDRNLIFKVERKNKILTLPVQIGYQRNFLFQKYGYLGLAPKVDLPKGILHKIQYKPIPALSRAWTEIAEFTYFNLLLLGKMITGKVSLQSLGGPITIFESAGQALNFGLLPFMGFLAFLSVTIGIINLLPIPGLDGGHLVIQTIEAAIGGPISFRVLLLVYRLGFIVLLLLIFQALVNDLLRFFAV